MSYDEYKYKLRNKKEDVNANKAAKKIDLYHNLPQEKGK